MAAQDLQILVVVDLYPGISVEELKNQLPDERDERVVLRLTELGAPHIEPPPDTKPIDWPAIGQAVEKMAARVHELQAARSTPTVVFVAGKGPLAAFTHLGYKLTKSVQRTIVLNQPPGAGEWQSFPIDSTGVEDAKLLDVVEGVPADPQLADGWLGLYVDTAGRSPEKQLFLDFLKGEGAQVASVMQLRSSKPLTVTPDNIGALARQLAQLVSVAPSRYPHRKGLALFTGVPTQVAFALGRAMSPNVLGEVWLTEYRHPRYQPVYTLPFAPAAGPPIPQDAAAQNTRRKVLDAMMDGIADLRNYLKPAHLPPGILPEEGSQKDGRKDYIGRLAKLQLSIETKEDQPFELRVVENLYTIGQGILHALARSTEEQQKSFAKLLLLHELLHDTQGLRSTNYAAIGRACFVLEQVDYAADVFALQAIMNMELDIGGQIAHDQVSKRLQAWLEMILHGIECFDLMEHGPKIERLPERRLRRYLLWHLQLARAMTVKQASHVEEMLRSSLTVELAPLAGYIDEKDRDKVVTRALSETELFIAIDGHLVRAPPTAAFQPGPLVDAVRTYSHAPIQQIMRAVVNEHRAKLAPWVA